MTKPFNNTGLYQKRRMWILIGMLMLVVIIPTVCLLWFVSEAVRNEQMAVRQRLTEVYQSHLKSLPAKLQGFWEEKINRLSAAGQGMSPGERFNRMIESGVPDTVIIYDSMGKILYPCEVEPPHIDLTGFSDDWERAEHLEFQSLDNQAAANLYSDIADKSKNISLKVRALQRQIRCLGKAGKKDEAVSIVTGILSNPEFNEARDDSGRLIVPDTKLFVLQSMVKKNDPAFREMLESLVLRVKNYGPPDMPSSQRLFLMKALTDIDSSIKFTTHKAEKLAMSSYPLLSPGNIGVANPAGNGLWQIVSSDQTVIAQFNLPALNAEKLASSSKLQVLQTGLYGLSEVPDRKGLWQITSSDGTVTALFNQGRIERESQKIINSNELYSDVRFVFAQKSADMDSKPLLQTDAGDYFPGWEITVQIEGDDLYMAASEKQVSLYIWTAMLIIVGILILAVVTTRLFVRQMSLARIKNDLITTVSHELKTPLTSIQLLVDTLIEGRYEDKGLEKEYHELISRETERLTALVENFLTFSRIEDKRQTFNFKAADPCEIVRSVYDTIKHRFESGGFILKMKVPESIPDIEVDFDAMTMVLLNLLDNAYNYSGKEKSVTLSTYYKNAYVCFEVKDKGIGLSADQKKKILKPFYQVDQTMSRKKSGFGLGLNIVRSIVDAHHGLMEIESEPGKGSVFTVKVPVA